MADRFIPAAQAQGGTLPTAGQDSGGLDAGTILGLARSGTNLAGQAGRFLQVPGSNYLSAAAGPLGVGQGIATGNPMQIAQSGLNTAFTGANLIGPLTGGAGGAAALGSLAGGAGGLGASMGPAVGGALLPASSAYGAAAGAGTLAGGTAASGGALSAGVAPALSALAGPAAALLAVIAIGINNMMAKKQARIVNQTQESAQIRQGGKKGLETLGQTQRFLPGLGNVPPEQLPAILEQYRAGLVGAPAVQQMIATRGQGGQAAKSKPLDQATLDTVSQAYYPALRDTQAGYLWALDAAARQGQPLPEWLQGFGQTDPAALLNNLSRGFGGAQDLGINAGTADYSQAVPGNLVNFFQQQVGSRDPQLGALLAGLPALPGAAPTPEAMAAQVAQRQQQAQALTAQNAGDINTQGTDIQSLAYTAPYTAGGLQASLGQALGASPAEQGMIADLLARGADPVGIRSALMESRMAQIGGGA